MAVALPLGRVGFVPRRDYTPGQECFPLDAVNYKNTLWACLARTTDVPGPTSPNWMAMLSLAAGLAPGGGLSSNEDGLVFVTREIGANILAPDGGLAANEDGLIFVAPDGFSESLLQELMRRMRLPVWITQDTTWYVDAVNGSDSYAGMEISTKAQTRDTAFKTLPAAIAFVTDNFNISAYAATIRIISTVDLSYAYVNLPQYNATSGTLRIAADSKIKLITYLRANRDAGTWQMHNLTLTCPSVSESGIAYSRMIIGNTNSTIIFYGCDFDASNADPSTLVGVMQCYLGGNIYIQAPSDNVSQLSNFTGIFDYVFSLSGGGLIQMAANLNFNMSPRNSGANFINATTLSTWIRGLINQNTGNSMAAISGTVSGTFNKVACSGNAIVNTGGGGGNSFFQWGTNVEPTSGGQIY